MKKVTAILLTTSVLCFWFMAAYVLAEPPVLQQTAEEIRLTTTNVTKLKTAIAKWRSLKGRYLGDIEVIGRNPDYKNAANLARANLQETGRLLGELETIISKERIDRERLTLLARKLDGLYYDGKYIFQGLQYNRKYIFLGSFSKYPLISKLKVDPNDCHTTHAGYSTTAQCLYCQGQPKDSCMCKMSGGCTCYCDNQCNCGDLSVFEEGSRENMLAGMCEASCHFSKKADDLFNTMAQVLKDLKETEDNVFRKILP